jgi:methionyl-tRNA synthetase
MENLMNKKTYITTAIPYVNGKPHIGFALELVQADVIARYNRLLGNDVKLQTGTDENAFKNVLTARQVGITTEELVTQNAKLFLCLAHGLNISFDNFVRTTDSAHNRGAVQFLKALESTDIYTKNYTGLYCTGCEDFYLEKDLINGCCPDHGTPPVEVHETNYFFRLSAYQEKLEELISSDIVKVIPVTRKNEVLSFINSGLRDFSVSRAVERSGGWGIPVPGDSSQIIYVA